MSRQIMFFSSIKVAAFTKSSRGSMPKLLLIGVNWRAIGGWCQDLRLDDMSSCSISSPREVTTFWTHIVSFYTHQNNLSKLVFDGIEVVEMWDYSINYKLLHISFNISIYIFILLCCAVWPQSPHPPPFLSCLLKCLIDPVISFLWPFISNIFPLRGMHMFITLKYFTPA